MKLITLQFYVRCVIGKFIQKIFNYQPNLHPAIFDILICGILILPYIRDPFKQGSLFIFYSIFLFCISMGMAPKREYKSDPLVIFLIISFVGIFLHNTYLIVPSSIMNYYFNISIMFEGFIYIFAGVLLLTTIIKYASDTKFILICAAISALPPLIDLYHQKNVTLILSLFISTFVWAIMNKKYRASILLLVSGLVVAGLKFEHIISKGICRGSIMKAVLDEIWHKPFLGNGFSHGLMADNLILCSPFAGQPLAYVYKHNDILATISALGIFAGIALMWFIYESLRKVGKSVYFIPLFTMFLWCNMKCIFFIPDRVIICLVVMAVCIKASIKKQGEEK